MTYNVFVGTLNLALSIYLLALYTAAFKGSNSHFLNLIFGPQLVFTFRLISIIFYCFLSIGTN